MLKQWVKRWLGIDSIGAQVVENETRMISLEADVILARGAAENSRRALDSKIKELDKLTREDWDIGMRGSSTIILTGVYRGRGYVQFYDVPQEEFHHLVERYREMRKENLIRNVDAPMFSGSFDIFR